MLFHTVYFGESADKVSAATAGGWMTMDPRFDPTLVQPKLQPNTTYYWRVDEFTGMVTHKGPVWSFTIAAPGGGLKAQYFNNRDLSGAAVVTRTDPQIDFNWGGGTVAGVNSPDAKIQVNDFSARWTGELTVDLTDTYVFTVTANNGFRLWVDGRAAIDFWENGTTDTRQSAAIPLTAGQTYTLRLDYYEGTDTALAQLFWESSIQNRVNARAQEIVPRGALGLPLKAHSPAPANGAVDAAWSLDLAWTAGDKASSMTCTSARTRQRWPAPIRRPRASIANGWPWTRPHYAVAGLEWGRTYYWRVDEIDPANPESLWKGGVWSFTTADFTAVDDFESYTDKAGRSIFSTWIDGLRPTEWVDRRQRTAANGTFGETRGSSTAAGSPCLWSTTTRIPPGIPRPNGRGTRPRIGRVMGSTP